MSSSINYTTLPPMDDQAKLAFHQLNGRGSVPPVECETCGVHSGDGTCEDCEQEFDYDLFTIKNTGLVSAITWWINYDDEPQFVTSQTEIDRADNGYYL